MDAAFNDWLEQTTQECSDSLQLALDEKVSGMAVDIDVRLASLLALAENSDHEYASLNEGRVATDVAKQPAGQRQEGTKPARDDDDDDEDDEDDEEPEELSKGSYPQYKEKAMSSLKEIRNKILELKALHPTDAEKKVGLGPKETNAGFGHIGFVEGGLVDISQFEGRAKSKVKFVNRYAQKYFHYYKGLMMIDVENKVRHHLIMQLAHKQGGNDDLHHRVQQVAREWTAPRRSGSSDPDQSEDTDGADDVLPKTAQSRILEWMGSKDDIAAAKGEQKQVTMKIKGVEEVLDKLAAVGMSEASSPESKL
jgi:hypothetical protein